LTTELRISACLLYALCDEEATRQKAVAEAVQHSSDRANTVLKSRGQKAGALCFVHVDVNNLTGVSEINLKSLEVGRWNILTPDSPAKRGGNSATTNRRLTQN
jgi:hypothetical protein